MSQPKQDYYKPGSHHVCRFCDTPLAKLVNGKLRSLSSKAHVSMLLDSGVNHRFNACKQCVKRNEFTVDTLKSIWEQDIDNLKNISILEGEDQEVAEARKELQLQATPIEGAFVRELTERDSARAISILNNKSNGRA